MSRGPSRRPAGQRGAQHAQLRLSLQLRGLRWPAPPCVDRPQGHLHETGWPAASTGDPPALPQGSGSPLDSPCPAAPGAPACRASVLPALAGWPWALALCGCPPPPRVRTGAFRPERQVESSLNWGFTPGEALLLLPLPPDARRRPAREQGKPAASTPRRAVSAAPRGTRGAAQTHAQPRGPRAQALEARPAPRACQGHLPGTSLGLTRDRVSSGASKGHPQLRPASPQLRSPALVWVFSHRVRLKGVLWLRPWILPFSDNCCLIMNCLFDELGARGGVKTNPVEETEVAMGASTRPPPGVFARPHVVKDVPS